MDSKANSTSVLLSPFSKNLLKPRLCKSRHAYYDRKYHFKSVNRGEVVVLDMVAQVRRELPA